MIDFVAIHSRLPRLCSGGGQNGCVQRVAAICAVAVAIVIFINAAWHPTAQADGGESARSKTSESTPDESGATIQSYALRILHALTDHDTNNWVRYWQARYACDAFAAQDVPATPLGRFLFALTSSICAQLDARLGVNPADYAHRGEERTVGLLAIEPDAAQGYTLFTGQRNNNVFLLDPLGRVVHTWHIDNLPSYIKLLNNGNLLNAKHNFIFEFDPRGNIVWQYGARSLLHHDFLKMPNGNVLLLVRARKTREQVIAAGANPEFVHENGIAYDYLLEVRPTSADGGEIVWEWSSWDHLVQDFDPSKPNYGGIAEHPELIDLNFLLKSVSEHLPRQPWDWLHTNTLDYNPELDQIMLSPRNFSELWIIDHSATTQEARGGAGGNSGMGGDLLYRWGNPRAYRHGDADDQRLFWQHQAHWIPPGMPGAGNILVFNNGWEFPGYERFYSSVDEIAPPVDGYGYHRAEDAAYHPDALEWTYAAETPADFYAPFLSGAQRLPNGNTLVVDGTAGTIFQTTPDGRIVWKYVAPLNERAHLRQGARASVEQTFPTPYGDPVPLLTNAIYRAYWYPPDHPALQALDLTPGAFIEDLPDIYDRAYSAVTAVTAGDFGERIASSNFDIYLDEYGYEYGRRLIYFRQPCASADAQTQFFLHIIPADARDLPDHSREHGFDNRDFNYASGAVQALDDWCVAMRRLPDYAIQRIRTGQFTDEGEVWRADIELDE